MFDEASDITMNSKLNVFVNILLASGDVKTLTLSLVGILLHADCVYLYRLKVLPMISIIHSISVFASRICIMYSLTRWYSRRGLPGVT